jgi:hypothetical protein
MTTIAGIWLLLLAGIVAIDALELEGWETHKAWVHIFVTTVSGFLGLALLFD